jgi:hypothetical protein
VTLTSEGAGIPPSLTCALAEFNRRVRCASLGFAYGYSKLMLVVHIIVSQFLRENQETHCVGAFKMRGEEFAALS